MSWYRKLSPIHALRVLYEWVVGWAHRPGGTIALGGIAFIEASFFPIPPDPLLWGLCVGNRQRCFWFGAVTTVCSVLGALLGYVLGAYLFLEIVHWGIATFGAESTWYGTMSSPGAAPDIVYHGVPLYANGMFFKAKALYDQWGFFAMFAAALTPIPFKVAAVAGGMFGMALTPFIVGSVLGRGMRFFAASALFYFFGDWARVFIDKYFTPLCIALAVLLIGGFAAIKYLL